jgi:hypothetical protein
MDVNRNGFIASVAVGVVLVALAVVASGQTPASPRQALPAPLAKPRVTVSLASAKPEVPAQMIFRESYSYQSVGRRDPFVSLMNNGELRPVFRDLKLVAVAFDPAGRNSVAVLRDVASKEQYRVRVGQEIGRMNVAAIGEKSVTFGIDEFGYSRQETLSMNDSTKATTQ